MSERTRWHLGRCRTYDDCPDWPSHIRDRCDDPYCTLEHVTIIRGQDHQIEVNECVVDPDGGVYISGWIHDEDLVTAISKGTRSGLSVEIPAD